MTITILVGQFQSFEICTSVKYYSERMITDIFNCYQVEGVLKFSSFFKSTKNYSKTKLLDKNRQYHFLQQLVLGP